MYLMFSLGRQDVFAVGDLGIRNAMKSLYGLNERPTIAELENIASIWAPHRSIASWYLWRALDQKVISTEYPV
jgi:DNA-3-methyladenine glycosylase II